MSIIAHAKATPDKPAFITAETGEALTFRELNEHSIRLARFARRSLNEGDRMSLLLENGPTYFIAAWAARRSALRFVPVNWHLKSEETVYIAQNSDSRGMIASSRLAEVAQSVADQCPALEVLIADGPSFGRFKSLADILASEPAVPLEPELEGGLMFYSSGTTGQPKGIMRPLSGQPFGEGMVGAETMQTTMYGFTSDTIYYSPAPLYHAAPLGWTLGTQNLGGTVVAPQRFDPEQTLRDIERYRITHVQFVPTHFVRMLHLPEETRKRYDLSSLKCVVHAAAPCPVDVKEKMFDWLGPIIHEYYGTSEGSGFTFVGPQEWLARKGTVGRPATKLHILDDEGRELPPGQVGHIHFEDPPRFEYHKEPGKTEAFFTEKGWSKPGDMGWLDEDGYLYLADRASHMIISGGVNIYPQEAESILGAHPAVYDVAVIGVPDPEFGEQVKAVVQLKPDVKQSPALAEELIGYCREKLAGFKCPKTVDFVDELPRLPTGKLLKRELRARYWGDRKSII